MKGAGIQVHVHDSKRGSSTDVTFYDFPVNVGRSEMADLSIDDPVVSKQHLSLKMLNNSVWATDEKSRNGTLIGGGLRMTPGAPCDLSQVGNTFTIGHLIFTVSVVNTANRLHDDRERGGVLLSGRLGNTPEAVRRPTKEPGRDARAAVDAVRPDCDASVAAVAKRRDAITARFEAIAPENRAEFLRLLAHEVPEVTNDPHFQALASRLALPMVELRAPDSLRVEEAAHRVLQELAAWYGVRSTMASVGEVIRFGRKIQDVCDALFSSVIPLRNVLKKFGQEIGVEHGAPKNEVMEWLERARTEQDVGAALLNSTTTAGDSWVAVRALCSDYIMHALSIPLATMEGVRSLLHELAPTTIESQLQKQPWYARVLFRADMLWKVYARRHDDLTTEDGETFRRLFGAEFASAYSQVFTSGQSEEVQRARQRQAEVRPVLAGESQVEERAQLRGSVGSNPPPANGTVVMNRAAGRPRGQ